MLSSTTAANGRAPAGFSPGPAPSPHFTRERVTSDRRLRFNPIRHLSPESLSRALDAFHLGYLRPAALLWDAMERRDDVLQGVAAKRKKSVSRLDWEILADDNSPAAQRHRLALEFFYGNLTATHACEPNQRGGLALLIKQMLDALGKKYAVHEIVWQRLPASTDFSPTNNSVTNSKLETPNSSLSPNQPPGSPRSAQNSTLHTPHSTLHTPHSTLPRTLLTATFRFAPLWFFEARTGPLRFLPDELAYEGIDLAPGQWLVTAADGLMESCSIAYLFKHLPLRDWLVYCERNGMPGVRGVTDAAPGTPEWDAAREAVRDFGAEFQALMSRGTEILPVHMTTEGELPYPQLVERMDRAMAALWRGADLSTLSRGQGLGASLQADEMALLEQDDAAMISETLNAQVDTFIIRELFGEERPRARFCLKPDTDAERLTHLELLQKLANLGAPIAVAGLHERLGLPVPSPDEPTLGKKG
jgi:phage gp29-like protein